jgi:hypothetical protein
MLMSLTLTRRLAGLILLGISLVVLAWGIWPLGLETRSLEFTPVDLGLAGGQDWQAILSWPPHLRAGETGTVHLELEPAGQGSSAAQPAAGLAHLAARLELAGLAFTPPGEVSQVILPGKPLTFAWQVQAMHAGEFPATLWLHRVDSAPPSRKVLSAQRLDFQASSLFGLAGPWARWLGAAGVLIGAFLGLDWLAARIWQRRQTGPQPLKKKQSL